jgi:hypothetical protein
VSLRLKTRDEREIIADSTFASPARNARCQLVDSKKCDPINGLPKRRLQPGNAP